MRTSTSVRSYFKVVAYYALVLIVAAYTAGYSKESWGEDYREQVITYNVRHEVPKGFAINQIGKIVRVAAKRRGWSINQSAEGGMFLSKYALNARARVSVVYDYDRVVIFYNDSNMMAYSPEDERIDKVYNAWVSDLASEIKLVSEEAMEWEENKKTIKAIQKDLFSRKS
ncbi:MAG: hypothetical protein GY804_07715 [Alphaproteobacteria bacterium]|nr:hypothetical protein [Alphaproteobacteria bacterium]